MTVPAPDPRAVRAASTDELQRLRLPVPPPQFPLVWQPGDGVALRSAVEMEARTAVLNVVLARCYGMPQQAAMSWLLNSHLLDAVTRPEWQFVMAGKGDRRALALHLEAIFGLTWLLGVTRRLEPTEPATDKLVDLLPDLPQGESLARWRSRTLVAPRDAATAAAMLDRYYCLDWAYLEAERRRMPLPGDLSGAAGTPAGSDAGQIRRGRSTGAGRGGGRGAGEVGGGLGALVDSRAIGQRRWALEWAVTFVGPMHGVPPGWEDIDLST